MHLGPMQRPQSDVNIRPRPINVNRRGMLALIRASSRVLVALVHRHALSKHNLLPIFCRAGGGRIFAHPAASGLLQYVHRDFKIETCV